MASVLNNTVRSKTLTGEEALQWIKDHPGKGYYDNNTGGFIEPERSGIANFLLGVSKPFRTAAAAPAGILMDIATRARGEYGDYMKEPPVKLPFLTGTESTAVREDPYLEFAKGAAGTASYFIPGGAAAGTTGLRAIASAAGRTGVSGLLGGFGYSPKGEELESTLKGGALGAVVGGGLQALGQLGTKLATPKSGVAAGEYTIDDIAQLSSKVKKNLRAQAKSAKLWDNTLGDTENLQFFLKNRELAGTTARETAENVIKEIERGKNLKKVGVGEIGQVGDDVLLSAKNNFEKAIDVSGFSDKIRKTSDYAGIDKYLSGKAGVRSAEELDKIIMKWQDIGRKTSGEVKDTIIAKAYTEGAKALRDSMRTLPTGVNYNAGLEILDNVSAVEKTGLVPKGLKTTGGTGIHPPFSSGANISVSPVVEAIDKTRAALGRMGESGISSPGLGGLLQKAPSISRPGVVPGIIGLGAGMPQETTAQERIQQPPMGRTTQPQFTYENAIQQAMSILPPGSDASDILAWAKFIMDNSSQGGMDLNMTQSKYYGVSQAAQSASELLDSMASSKEQPLPGFGRTITSAIGDLFNISDPLMLEYRNKIASIDLAVSNLIAGTNISASESKRLHKLVPTMNDSVSEAKSKLAELDALGITGAGLYQEEISDQYGDY